MDYWEGTMNWPIDPDWACEVCGMTPAGDVAKFVMGAASLTWGLCHGTCRCDLCHVQYTMRDWQAEGKPRVTTPICLLRPEFKVAFIKVWAEHHRPVDQITDAEWEAAGIVLEATTD